MCLFKLLYCWWNINFKMSGLFIIPIVGFYLLVFSAVFYLAYKYVRVLPHYTAIRTWLVVFYAEIVLLMFIPAGVYIPGLPTLYRYGGFDYLMTFTELSFISHMLHHRSYDELILLLVPLVPALLAYFYTRR